MIFGNCDVITREGAAGWAFSDDGAAVVVEAWCDGVCLGTAIADRVRPDVEARYPRHPDSRRSGFYVVFAPLLRDQMPTRLLEVEVSARAIAPAAAGKAEETRVIGTGLILREGSSALAAESCGLTLPVGPFPGPVAAAVAALWPDLPRELSSASAQRAVAERIVTLASLPGADGLDTLMHYVRFVRSVRAHCEFVKAYFPKTNPGRDAWAKDYFCRAIGAEEVFAIAHHLYVLKSHGVAGEFAEFGCFRGYSTAMLSLACHELGIRMHVLDSFAGLPPSESTFFKAGDFSTSLDEVRQTIQKFGSPDAVAYHPGFFRESLQALDPFPLMSLWIDVDLEQSVRDIMSITHWLDSRGAIFVHECRSENFQDGMVSSAISPDHVLPPILDRFIDLGERATGTLVCGQTGALWRAGKGVPVLSSEALTILWQQL